MLLHVKEINEVEFLPEASTGACKADMLYQVDFVTHDATVALAGGLMECSSVLLK